MNRRRVLITGGAGFLGYHLANALPSHGVQFLACNDIAPFDPDEYPEGSLLAEVDIRDHDSMRRLLIDNRIDTVVHSAAALPLWTAEEIRSTNVDGLKTTLELSQEAGVERFIFISSTAVYGMPDKHPVSENDPLIGIGPYGETKIIGEELCRQYADAGMNITILRPKTFIGVARLGIFQILYDWVDSGARIPIIGRGDNLYQLLEVGDLIEAIVLAAEADPEAANDTFNVGAQKYEQVRIDVGALCEFGASGSRVMPTPAPLVKGALALFEFMRISPLYKWVYGTADQDSYVSTDRIENKLGWKAKHSNQDALIMSHRWYLEHKEELQGRKTGVTHRSGWNQGILKLFKRLL